MSLGDRLLRPGLRPLLVLLAATLPALPRLTSGSFCLDDAFIHLSYVKSLHLGEGLSYNPGDFETGISSPLWVLLLALIPSVSPPVWSVKLVGLACHAATALLAMRLAARLVPPQRSATASLASGLLVATTPWLVQGAISGMEVSLTALLFVWATETSHADVFVNRHETRSAAVRATWPAAAAGALAYLARPEALAFSGLLSALLWRRSRKKSPWAATLGALSAAGLWSTYLWAVSGHPLPNTFYVKGGGGLHWQSLRYLGADLLALQPAIISVSGPIALVLALRRADHEHRAGFRDLSLLCLGTLLAIALTRDLSPGTLFFHARHLAPVMWIPPLLVGLSLAYASSAVRAGLSLPLVATTGIALAFNNGLIARQESGVTTLHVKVASYASKRLPRTAVLAVEGAGALRYFTPRSMRVIDLMGLNTGPIAHAPRLAAMKLCYAENQRVTHLAYLGGWHDTIRGFMKLEVLSVFEEPEYAQTLPPTPYSVVIAKVTGLHQDFALPCTHAAREQGW